MNLVLPNLDKKGNTQKYRRAPKQPPKQKLCFVGYDLNSPETTSKFFQTKN